MENLEIHSKSYLVRWISAAGGRTISWSIQPHKKSINLGLFKHPGGNPQLTSALSASTFVPPPTPHVDASNAAASRAPSSRNDASTAAEKLQRIGLLLIQWIGRCEADKVSMGSYDIPADQGGMYALVFDNTFSKQVSKTATFVLMTYPTNTPPETTHHLHHLNAGPAATVSTSSLGSRPSPRMSPVVGGSTDSLHDRGVTDGAPSGLALLSPTCESPGESKPQNFHMGVLQKRRRKRHQGFARRFFSLDFTSGTLSYYHDQHSSALRGAIPLSLAVVGANDKTRELSIDSGAEVWHLRAATARDFDSWKRALEKASSCAANGSTTESMATSRTANVQESGGHAVEEQDWARIEALVGRVAGIRDAIRRLASETRLSGSPDPSRHLGRPDIPNASPSDMPANDYFQDKDRRSFWKRKTSNGNAASHIFRRTSSGQRSHPGPTTSPLALDAPNRRHANEMGMHGHCLALLNDMDAVVTDFSQLIAGSKRRRLTRSRHSIDSTSTAEYFDAPDSMNRNSQVVRISDSEDEHEHEHEHQYEHEGNELAEDNFDSVSTSDAETAESLRKEISQDEHHPSLFPSRPKSLAPLPLDPVKRRSTIPPAKTLPPSLIGFLKKNVGKDLSTISMPVSANEPLSLLQRAAEQVEYSSLLDDAATMDLDSTARLLYITAFAISSLSNCRVKERAIRKPFNPMLGETFELVREDRGFRFLAEKVSHRPVRMACHAEAHNWTYSHSPMPTQKFWGKSAEIATDGKVRVILHTTGDRYSWTMATCYLRNIIAGEKYVEPVGTMTVLSETSGEKAIATFKSKGMFSGRSEEVYVQAFSSDGRELPAGLTGKWTSHLTLSNGGGIDDTIWRVGPLVDSPAEHYGFTRFAASLNEITVIEAGPPPRLPRTDSRLRPDQRAVENGQLDAAETIKAQLEEAQRARRRDHPRHEPRWFEKVESGPGGPGGGPASPSDEEEIWCLKKGRDGYWEERERLKGEWSNIGEDLFRV